MRLEELIYDMVKRGELTDLSLSPRGDQWSATFAPASPASGFTFVLDKDPVNALRRAIVETKLRKRRGNTREQS